MPSVQPHPDSHVTDALPAEIHAAVEKLFASLGAPVRSALASVASGGIARPDEVDGHHPVFALAQHFLGHDKSNPGYTWNPYRGDHLTVPCVYEDGGAFAIDLSFHKGSTHVDRVDFPQANSEVMAALRSLLWAFETR